MATEWAALADEASFPGNLLAIARLQAEVAAKRLVGFTGAGTSIPLAPSWSGLLTLLIRDGEKEGFISSADSRVLLHQMIEDPLEVASSLEEAYTTARFRTKIAELFTFNGKTTDTHELIINLGLSSLITLNYDDGLSTAYVRKTQILPNIIRPDDKYDLHRWAVGNIENAQTTIIHWHGVAAAPDRIILTADDYSRFYGAKENITFIEELWRNKRLLAIGFGFSDPMLTRLAESVLRSLPADNQHLALIGWADSVPLSPLMRRQFSKRYRLDPVFYRVVHRPDGSEDHSALGAILLALKVTAPETVIVQESRQATLKPSPVLQAEQDLKAGLFVGPNGQALYVEPRLFARAMSSEEPSQGEIFVNVSEIVSSCQDVIISAAMETGGTTLGRRLAVEFLRHGSDAVIRDATELPNYKKALLGDEAFKPLVEGQRRVLILDRFDPGSHERLIKEICGIGNFSRLIVLTRTQPDENVIIDDMRLNRDFWELSLSYLHRQDIRSLASDLYDTYDSDTVSAAVEKTYSDLLELCIPLTPLNVIMYLSVVHREGSFTPFNRLQIMERFIKDLLHRPSDVYRDAFNADNKTDVISAFVFNLYKRAKVDFTRNDWDTFCLRDMRDSMTWFDKDSLFSDLLSNRVIVPTAGCFIFKYKLYYAYFVGKYVAQRPGELKDLIKNGLHLNLDGLVEIISGISKENDGLVLDLVERLEDAISDFERQYETGDFDPYVDMDWPDMGDENEQLWKPVIEKLAQGPASDSEVDRLKRSIIAESRTADQNVVIREFSDAQRSVSFNQVMLVGAVRESQRLPAELKARAMRALYMSYRIFAQIGFLFAPIIATRRFFVWNNVAFYNVMNFKGYDDATLEEKAAMVAGALPRAVVSRATDELGSRRLGTVFQHMVDVDSKVTDFGTLLTLAFLCKSKPDGWEISVRKLLDGVDRRAIYLQLMLGAVMRQFNQEVNTNAERLILKKTVALIHAKRDVKKALPNSKAVGKALKRLEDVQYFEQNARAEVIEGVNVQEVEAEVDEIVDGTAVQIDEGDLSRIAGRR